MDALREHRRKTYRRYSEAKRRRLGLKKYPSESEYLQIAEKWLRVAYMMSQEEFAHRNNLTLYAVKRAVRLNKQLRQTNNNHR